MTHHVISMALMKTLPQQESEERNYESYAWGQHIHDGTHATVIMLACCARDWPECILSSLLFKWLHCRVEKEAACVFLQNIQALDSLNAPAAGASCGIYCADTEHSNNKIFGLLRLCEKPDLKTNHNRSVRQAGVQAVMLVVRAIVWLLTTQASSHGSLLWSLSIYLWIIHTFISHCSGFQFDWNLQKLWTNQIKLSHKIYYSRIQQNCPTETDFKTVSPWMRMGNLLYFCLNFDSLWGIYVEMSLCYINRVHKDAHFHSFMGISASSISRTTTYEHCLFKDSVLGSRKRSILLHNNILPYSNNKITMKKFLSAWSLCRMHSST